MPPPSESLTEGSPVRALLRLALPFMVGNVLNLVVLLADRLWVGEVGTAALAALGVAHVSLMIIGTVMMGMGVGTLAGVARNIGIGDTTEASRYYGRGLLLAVGLGVALIGLAFVVPEPLLEFMEVGGEVGAPAAAYLRISMWGAIFQVPMFVQNFALQGAGEARAALVVSTVSPLLNAALDPLFIFGLDMGLPGAAWASLASYAAGFATGAWLIGRGRLRLGVSRASFAGGGGITRRIVKVGVPGTLEHLVRTLASFSLVTIIAPFGKTVLSAYSTTLVLAMALVIPGLAIGQAAAALMGQNLGAGRPRRAWHTAWIAVGLYAGMMCVAGVLVHTFAEPLIAAFDDNPAVVREGALLLRIQVFAYPAIAVALGLSKAFGGAGTTLPAMLSAAVGHLFVQIPAAWYFSQIHGPVGAYWAMASAFIVHAVVQAALFIHRFRPGGPVARAAAAGALPDTPLARAKPEAADTPRSAD